MAGKAGSGLTDEAGSKLGIGHGRRRAICGWQDSTVRPAINAAVAGTQYRQCATDITGDSQGLRIGKLVADIEIEPREIAVDRYGALHLGTRRLPAERTSRAGRDARADAVLAVAARVGGKLLAHTRGSRRSGIV